MYKGIFWFSDLTFPPQPDLPLVPGINHGMKRSVSGGSRVLWEQCWKGLIGARAHGAFTSRAPKGILNHLGTPRDSEAPSHPGNWGRALSALPAGVPRGTEPAEMTEIICCSQTSPRDQPWAVILVHIWKEVGLELCKGVAVKSSQCQFCWGSDSDNKLGAVQGENFWGFKWIHHLLMFLC